MDDDQTPEIPSENPDSSGYIREVAGVIPFIRREERKPGDWTIEVQKEAKEKLGINVLSPNEFPEGLNSRPNQFVRKQDVIYNEELADEICERLLCGETLSSICQDDKMPDFKEKVALAKKEGTHYIADDCMRIADDQSLDPSHKRLMVDTRIRLIKSWNARAYADNVKVSGDDGAPPVRFFIEGLSDRIKD